MFAKGCERQLLHGADGRVPAERLAQGDAGEPGADARRAAPLHPRAAAAGRLERRRYVSTWRQYSILD